MDSIDFLFSVLTQISWSVLALGVLLGAAGGLALGLLIMTVLHKTGLLRRQRRWLGYAVKLYWLFIPGVLTVAGLQIGLVHGAWRGADTLVAAAEAPIRNVTRAFLGELQTQLNGLIEQSPALQNVSLDALMDEAITRSLRQLPAASSASLSEDPAAWATTVFTQAVRSTWLHDKVRETLIETAQQVSGADKTSINLALKTSLGQLAEDNVVFSFVRERLRKLFWRFVQSVLLIAGGLLLIPGAEIGLAKWRKW